MAPDANRPSRAAKAAAMENAVWLNGKGSDGQQKRARSPERSLSTSSTKKARRVAGVRTKSKDVAGARTKAKAKSDKHMPTQRPAPSPIDARVKPRRDPVPIDVESDDTEDNNINQDDSDNDQSGDERERESEGEGEPEDQDDLRDLGPTDVHATFEKESVQWDAESIDDAHMEVNAATTRRHNTFSVKREPVEEVKPRSTKSARTSNRAASRLAEVPQWEDSEVQSESDDTRQGSGTPLSSGAEDDESDKDLKVPINKQKVNIGWPSASHYVPAGSGRCIVKLRIQPSDLRAIIRASIHKVVGDAVFETAYRPVNGLNAYYRYTLWKSAKSLNFSAYAKRFDGDPEIGKAIGRVLNGRLSICRGQVKRAAVSKVEGFYQLIEGQGCVQHIKTLIVGSMYIYPTRAIGPGGALVPMRSKPFSHPALVVVLRESFFSTVRGGSLASKHHERFKSSLPDLHPSELEIPSAMLALAATSIHSALDDYSTGMCRKTEFNADMYEDIYLGHMTFLSHIRDGSIAKYHRMMADLYTQASAASVMPRTTIVTNDAIAQLDLEGMAE